MARQKGNAPPTMLRLSTLNQQLATSPMRLTRDEIILVVGIVIALVTGVVIKHYRAERRAAAAVATAGAEPTTRSQR